MSDKERIDFIEQIGRKAGIEAWQSAPPNALLDKFAAFQYAHGAGLLFGYRCGLETVAKILEDPIFDSAGREVIAAVVRDLVGQIEHRFITRG